MKQYVLLLAGLFLFACKSEREKTATGDDKLASGKLEISGELTGLDNGYVEVMNVYSVETKKVDSVPVVNGKFTYTTQLAEPLQMAIRKAGAQGEELVFFADPGKVTINGSNDSIWAAKVEAGKTQALFKEAQDSIKNIMLPGKPMYEAYIAAQTRQDAAEMQRLQDAYIQLQNRSQQFVYEFGKRNKGSIISPYLALIYLNEEGKETELKQLYAGLTASVKGSFFGKKVGESVNITEGTGVGALAANFTLPDVNGKPVSLSSYKGKYVLIDFWASWCGPCRQENPNVVNAYNEFHAKGLEILGVSLDSDKDSWLKAIEADKLSWTHVSDLQKWDSEAAKLYGVQAIPANFLLDTEGRIIAKNLRGDALKEKLASLMP